MQIISNSPELKQRARKKTIPEIIFFMFYCIICIQWVQIGTYLIDPKIARLVGRVAKRKKNKFQCISLNVYNVHSWLPDNPAHQLFQIFVFCNLGLGWTWKFRTFKPNWIVFQNPKPTSRTKNRTSNFLNFRFLL